MGIIGLMGIGWRIGIICCGAIARSCGRMYIAGPAIIKGCGGAMTCARGPRGCPTTGMLKAAKFTGLFACGLLAEAENAVSAIYPSDESWTTSPAGVFCGSSSVSDSWTSALIERALGTEIVLIAPPELTLFSREDFTFAKA